MSHGDGNGFLPIMFYHVIIITRASIDIFIMIYSILLYSASYKVGNIAKFVGLSKLMPFNDATICFSPQIALWLTCS